MTFRAQNIDVWLSFLTDVMGEIAPKAIEEALERGVERMKLLIPVKTGATRDSVELAGGYPHFEVLSNDVLVYLVKGTQPHTILPRFKRALWWPEIRVGHPIARAEHPGISPRLSEESLAVALLTDLEEHVVGQVVRQDP